MEQSSMRMDDNEDADSALVEDDGNIGSTKTRHIVSGYQSSYLDLAHGMRRVTKSAI